MHNYFTNYHTPPTYFDTIVSSSESLQSYTSISNAAVGNTAILQLKYLCNFGKC